MVPRHSRGVALLTVLFILVLLTTMSVYMVEDEHMALRRVSNQRELEQSYQAATASEQWALKVLERDLIDNEYDHLNEDWNKLDESGGVKVEDGALKTAVIDQQGLFNLNNLENALTPNQDPSQPPVKSPWFEAFERLLQNLDLEPQIAAAVVDWIDNPENGDGPVLNSSFGAEDSDYQLFEPPYRAANQAFNDVGELLLVKGFGLNELRKLIPYITVLPATDTKINVNTASELVLRSLHPELLNADFQGFVAIRSETPFESEDVAFIDPVFAGIATDQLKTLMTVSSDYFDVHSDAQFGRILFKLESLVKRDKGTEVARVVRRRRGLS